MKKIKILIITIILLLCAQHAGAIDVKKWNYAQAEYAALDGTVPTPPTVTIPAIPTPSGTVYYMREDGTAANKAAATDPSAAATSMSVAKFNSETFVDGEIVKMSSQGGNFTSIVTPGDDGGVNAIKLTNVDGESPHIDATGNNFAINMAKSNWVISGISMSGSTLMAVSLALTCDNVYFDDITITSAGTYGFYVNANSSELVISNSNISNTTNVGIQFANKTVVGYIDGATIVDSGSTGINAGISANVNLTINNTDVTGSASNGIAADGAVLTVKGGSVSGGASNGVYTQGNVTGSVATIEDVDIYDNATDGGSANELSDATFFNCTIYNNGSANANSGDGLTAHDTSTLNAYGNILYGNWKSGIAVTGASTGDLVNNKCYNNYDATNTNGWTPSNGMGLAINSTGTWTVNNNVTEYNGSEFVITSTATGSITSDYNDFYNSRGDGYGFHYQGSNYTTIAAFVSASSTDANSIDDNPLFLNTGISDFRMRRSSPTIPAGIAVLE